MNKKIFIYPLIVLAVSAVTFGVSSGVVYNSVHNGQTNESEEVKVTLNSIEIIEQPTKTIYEEGETFDPTGIKIQANYSDESTKILSENDYDYNKKGTLLPSDTTVTFTYRGRKADLPIVVNPRPEIINLTITDSTPNTYRVEAEDADLTYCHVPTTGGYNQESNVEINANASGGKTLGVLGETGNKFSYIIETSLDIEVDFYVAFAFASGSQYNLDAGIEIKFNDQKLTTGAVVTGSGWSKYTPYELATLSLKEGKNHIVFEVLKYGSTVNLDYLEFVVPEEIQEEPELSNSVRIEIEDLDLSEFDAKYGENPKTETVTDKDGNTVTALKDLWRASNGTGFEFYFYSTHKESVTLKIRMMVSSANSGYEKGTAYPWDEKMNTYVNGQQITTGMSANVTTGWYEYQTISCEISANSGVNTVRFTRNGAILNIDWFEIHGTEVGVSAKPTTLRYQVEDLDLSEIEESYGENPKTETITDTDGNVATVLKDFWRVKNGLGFGFTFKSETAQKIVFRIRGLVSSNNNKDLETGDPFSWDSKMITYLNNEQITTNMIFTAVAGYSAYQTVECVISLKRGINTMKFVRNGAILNIDWFEVSGTELSKQGE